ncbi:hypothetical protein SRB5_67180 [Streptomyces sp. RB5]|uniref:DUF4232 domain-containing protein n=1 Tax=Streptomyces smaragdinus TaxID=2585196 RepID=A0A7K0CSS4_9ACTN|nr:hypothetical protein [Streptomyces smaragdinus]MQY16519.1 hypothetical protein [Streptomyces smaragdinus]
MGSLRNPVGPLPSNIYWRRRGLLAALVALLALVIAWAFTLGGGGGGGDKPEGKGPAVSITPGPSSSGPLITGRPGGGGETDNGDKGDDGNGTPGSGASDEPGDAASGDGGGTGGGDTGGGTEAGGGTGGSGTNGFPVGDDGVPSESTLPDCDSSAVTFRIRSTQKTYQPGEKPEFELTATNAASSACKLAFGPEWAVITIRDADDDTRLWSSEDCPWTSNAILLEVPAGGSMQRTITWDRVRSAPECAEVKARSVGTGGFQAELKPKGLPLSKAQFTLDA